MAPLLLLLLFLQSALLVLLFFFLLPLLLSPLPPLMLLLQALQVQSFKSCPMVTSENRLGSSVAGPDGFRNKTGHCLCG
jgi:hypothetical protein